MKDFAYLITAYRQKDLTEENIKRIRNEYKTSLKDSPIVIVTTSEDDKENFGELQEKYPDVYVLHFPNAPGSEGADWFHSKENPAGQYISWRHEFLPPRILISLQKAMCFANDMECIKAIHLHSDSYIPASYEEQLIKDIYLLDTVMIIADVSEDDEASAAANKVIPPMMHLHIEGLMLNLTKCLECGYGFTFSNIFDKNSGFQSHNYGSIEALLAQYAIYCLSGVGINKFDQELPKEYFQNVYFRMCRQYHGCWDQIVNLHGKQPDAKELVCQKLNQ